MPKTDDLHFAVPLDQQEFPMNPQLCSFGMFRTDDEEVYKCMMKAIFKYRQARAQAEVNLYKALLECING